MDNCEKQERIDCSVIVPLYNEAEVVRELYQRLRKTLQSLGVKYELVFVNDGSGDGTGEILQEIAGEDDSVLVVELGRNFGQTAALAAGFDYAHGQILITMDGDLQHLPEEIPAFLEKIHEGYDVVTGWREKRVDSFLIRRLPSKIANWIAAEISGVNIHDFGSTFKAFRRRSVQELNLYGEMHRFIPALLARSGARIIEIPITNIVRPRGTSKYGLSRTFRVALDLITLRFLLGYLTRPLHFFGKAAFYCILTSSALGVYILYDKFVYKVPIFVGHAPLAGLATLLFITAMIFISTGLIGEMLSRIYFEATGKKIYSVRRILHRNQNQCTEAVHEI
jgi:glycosyltransferase involved in cell wall biosynthesis